MKICKLPEIFVVNSEKVFKFSFINGANPKNKIQGKSVKNLNFVSWNLNFHSELKFSNFQNRLNFLLIL